jgi:hypothetical protein
METATQLQKRVRIDSSAFSPEDAMSTPMAAARSTLKNHCESLQPEIATLLQTLGKEHLLTLQKILHKDTQIKKLQDDDELIPRSARIKFTLTTSKLAEADPGYTGLKEETETLVLDFQKSLKTKIIKVTELEVKLLRAQIQVALASNLFVVTKALLICDTLTPDPHQIVNTILEEYAAPLLLSFEMTVDDFRKLYCTTHTIEALPPPIAGAAVHPLGHDAANIPTPVLQTFVKIYRVIEDIFLAPWTSYIDMEKRLAIAVALKTLRVEHLEPAATDSAAMLIDSEAAVEPPQLRAIIDAQVTSKLAKELAALKITIATLKNQPRGPPGGASLKKKNQAGKADANANATKNASTAKEKKKKPATTSPSKPKSILRKKKRGTP